MIKVVMRSAVKNESRLAVLKLYQQLIAETLNEKGCISYELFHESDNPNKLTLFEEWESYEALEMHIQTEHFKRIVPQLAELETEEPMLIYQKVIFP